MCPPPRPPRGLWKTSKQLQGAGEVFIRALNPTHTLVKVEQWTLLHGNA